MAGNVASVIGASTGTLGGINTAIKAVKVANTANTVEEVLGAGELLTNSSVDKRLIITEFYVEEEINYATAVNSKGTKFTIALPEALLVNEIILLK